MAEVRFRTRELLPVVVIVALVLVLVIQQRATNILRMELRDREAMLHEELRNHQDQREQLIEDVENLEMELRDLGYEWNRDLFQPRTRPTASQTSRDKRPSQRLPNSREDRF